MFSTKKWARLHANARYCYKRLNEFVFEITNNFFFQTNRWRMALFSNMVDVSAYNAFVIFTDINPNYQKDKQNHRRRIFLKDLATALIEPHIQRRSVLPRAINASLFVQKVQSSVPGTAQASVSQPASKRGRCFLCEYDVNGNKQSTKCGMCNKFVCKEHLNKLIICTKCEEKN